MTASVTVRSTGGGGVGVITGAGGVRADTCAGGMAAGVMGVVEASGDLTDV